MSSFDPVAALHALADHGVRFVLIGGLAGRAWGSPLITTDTDVIYDRSVANIERLATALQDLGARLRGADDDAPFLLDARTIEAGSSFTFNTSAGPLDVLGQASGVDDFERLYASGDDIDIAGVMIRVASLGDLITMKRAAGRLKDRLAVEELGALEEERAKWRDVE